MSLQHIKCPHCGTPMTYFQSFSFHMCEGCQTEEHKAKQREYDTGIIHDWKCKMTMIDVPKLKFNFPFPRNKE